MVLIFFNKSTTKEKYKEYPLFNYQQHSDFERRHFQYYHQDDHQHLTCRIYSIIEAEN
jgi:hypothetical protein